MKNSGGLVVNEAPAKVQFSTVTFNLQTNKASLRHDRMEGRDYLVAPCIMLTEGVHAGSQGPLYYPAEELAKTPAIWNSKPVVVYHPKVNGQSVSACDPVIFDKQRIGLLMNTRFEGGKLKTDCWLEPEKMRVVDDRVLNAIENGDVMEVSTGLFTDNESAEGEWKGEKYTAIARNYRPDHLAVLPDQTGACSVADGAGLLRNSAGGTGPEALLAKSLVAVFNEMSHSEIWAKLNTKIRPAGVQDMPDAWVLEVWDDFFIYEKGGRSYYQEYVLKDNEVELKGLHKEAVRVTRFKLPDGTMVGNTVQGDGIRIHSRKGVVMDKAQVVNQLIANEKSPWKEGDRAALMQMSEEQLKAIVGNVQPVSAPAPVAVVPPAPVAVVPPAPAPVVVEPKAGVVNQSVVSPVTVDQYIANAPVGMRDMLRAGLLAHAEEKAKLVAKITANQRNPFSLEQLNAKDLDELRGIAQLAEVVAPPVQGGVNYRGMGEPAPTGNQVKVEEPLVAPVMNFGKE